MSHELCRRRDKEVGSTADRRSGTLYSPKMTPRPPWDAAGDTRYDQTVTRYQFRNQRPPQQTATGSR